MKPYRILRQLRKSNWIQSYLAIERKARRQVVVKFVVHPQAAEDDWYRSFAERLTAVRRLSQQRSDLPLAAIYDWGRLSDPYETPEDSIPAGVPYFVLEYIEGESLADMLAQFTAFPIQLAADILEQIAPTLDKIHTAGLTHGNLKPSNIIIGPDDKMFLTDFHLTPSGGLLMDIGDQLTLDEAAYVSPEQTQSARAVNQFSDIYNLGLILFEMVTRRRPFAGPSVSRLLRQHAFDLPPSARRFNSDLPAALDHILEKALAKNDLARYATAGEMAAALRQIVSPDEPAAPLFPAPVVVPVTSMAPDPLTTVTLIEPESPAPAAKETDIEEVEEVILLDDLAAASLEGVRPPNERPSPPIPPPTAPQPRQSKSRLSAAFMPVTLITLAALVVLGAALISVIVALVSRPSNDTAAAPATAVATTAATAPPASGQSLSLEEMLMGSLDLSLPPSGPQPLIEIGRYGEGKVEEIKVAARGTAIAVGGPAGLALYDVTDLSLIDRPLNRAMETLAWMDNGRLLATPDRQNNAGVVNIWNETGQLRQQLNTGKYNAISKLAAPPTGNQLAVLQAGVLQIWSIETGQMTGEWLFEPQSARYISWSPDGEQIAVALDNQTVKIIHTRSEAIILTLDGGNFNIVAMAWSPNSAYLAGVAANGQMIIWATADGQVILQRRGVKSVGWTDNSRYLIGGLGDGQIIFWDAADIENQWQVSITWPGHDAAVAWLQWLNDPPRLLSWSEDGWLQLRDGRSGELLAERGHFNSSLYNAVSGLAWSPDGDYLAAGSWDTTIRIWQTEGMTVSQQLRDHRSYIGPVAWSPDGEWIASGGIDGGGTLRLRNLTSGETASVLFEDEGPPRSLAFSPDGRWLAVGLDSGALSLRAMPPDPDGILLSGQAADGRISGLAWSPNGQQLLAAGLDGTITVWEIPGGTLLRQWQIEEASFNLAAAWSPTEPVIALARSMREVEFWSSDSWHLIRTVEGVQGVTANALAFSSDGRWLAMVGGRENVIVFATAAGEVAYIGEGHASAVRSVVWSPIVPNRLASGGDDGVIRLWLLPEGQPGR